MMDWPEAVEIVVARTGHGRYRDLCADAHPDREAWRRNVVELAAGEPPRYPPLATQAGNLAGAVGRIVGAAVRGEPIMAMPDVLEARRAICLPCESNGERASGGIRCTKCGCGGMKLALQTEACPVGKW